MRFDKFVFFALCLGTLVFASFVFGAYSATRQTFPFVFLDKTYDHLKEAFREVRISVESTFTPGSFHLQPVRYAGEGVVQNDAPDQESLVFLTGFFDGKNELRLIRRDGDIVARWPVVYSDYFPDTSFLHRPPANDFLTDLHGAVLNPDGSVVFNFEYNGAVKLSRCGELDWTLEHPTHHSVERAEGGGYWIPGRISHTEIASDAFPPFTIKYQGRWAYQEDLILKVSEGGEILTSVSLPQIFYDNGLVALLTANGHSFVDLPRNEDELVHLNKIGELPAAIADRFSGFEAGDLVLSMRDHNLVMVVDPDSWKIRWHQIGPWIRQHDPVFNPDGTITVFNNNVYYGLSGETEKSLVSNIMRVDPAIGETVRIYGEQDGEMFQTVLRGKHDLTPAGGYIITEFEAGRAFEINDKGNIVWDYINYYDDDFVAEITEARVFPPSYFTVKDWSCP